MGNFSSVTSDASRSVQGWRSVVVTALRLRVWLTESVSDKVLESPFFGAALVGFLAALSSVAFREAFADLTARVYRYSGPIEGAVLSLPWWQRLLIPTLGGAAAGAILLLSQRWSQVGRSLDFMEAVSLGDGIIRVRATVFKSLSSLVTISTGGSIGREGPMVQLAAMLGSLLGRTGRVSPARRRLLVACGAAAGIACVYNAPVAGAFFVAEILLGSIAMESFGPLVCASVTATVTARQFLGAQPVYQMPAFSDVPNWQLPIHAGLGLVAGLIGPLFLIALRAAERFFQRQKLPIVLRLALGGLIVGVISIRVPGVCGNGYGEVESILNQEWTWSALVLILLAKVLATMATAGSGAVGGVFTPTLFVGAVLGALYGEIVRAIVPGHAVSIGAFAVVGMGCFLTATTRAPIMAILIMFEMTLNYAAVMPLMLACVVSYYLAKSSPVPSVYQANLRGGSGSTGPLFLMRVGELMRPEPLSVRENVGFATIAQTLAAQTSKHLYVVDAQKRFLGAIALQDLKPFLAERNFPALIIALDLLRDDIPMLTIDESLKESLDIFTRHDGERLPVLNNLRDRTLVGALAKNDVLLTLAHGAPVGPAGSGPRNGA